MCVSRALFPQRMLGCVRKQSFQGRHHNQNDQVVCGSPIHAHAKTKVCFSKNMAKPWSKPIDKRKKILLFRSFRVTCKISLVPGTGLEPALLSEHAPETCASTNSATRATLVVSNSRDLLVCKTVPRTRLELAPPYGDYPLKVACLPIPPPGQNFLFLSKAVAKILTFFDMTKKNSNYFVNSM